MMLGKKTPRYDVRTLHLARYLTPALPPPPNQCDWTSKMSFPCGEMLNDQLGDCTCAAAGHAIQLWTANSRAEITVPDSAILSAYEAVSGYVPGNPSSDQGAVELDVLKYWRTTGIGGHKLDAFADVSMAALDDRKQTVALFGCAYIGLALPLTAQNQIGKIWDVTDPSLSGDAAPGSWGDHAVIVVAYTPDGWLVITWGQLQFVTERFMLAYCDEWHAPLSLDWLNKSGVASSGIALPLLTRDLGVIGAVA